MAVEEVGERYRRGVCGSITEGKRIYLASLAGFEPTTRCYLGKGF